MPGRRGGDRARLARPGLACEGARRGAGDARSPRRPGERRACSQPRGPTPAPDRAPRRGRAHARHARSRAPSAGVAGRPRAGGGRDRDPASADEAGARGARPGRARSARGGHPGPDGGGHKRVSRAGRARSAPDRGWRGTPPPARGGRSAAGVRGARRGRMPPCRTGRAHGCLARDASGLVRAGARAGRSLARRRAEEHARRTRLPGEARR